MGEKTLASRSMLVTGLLLGLFLIIHILDFRVKKLLGMEGSENLGLLVRDRVTSPVGLGIYVAAAILIGLHLSHGFKSAFQSLGLYHNKFNGTIRFVGYALAILLALGFAGIPVALFMGAGGPL
jgi:succinate dehydrogenase / fumarate reductase cytochrome b subunit